MERGGSHFRDIPVRMTILLNRAATYRRLGVGHCTSLASFHEIHDFSRPKFDYACPARVASDLSRTNVWDG